MIVSIGALVKHKEELPGHYRTCGNIGIVTSLIHDGRAI